MPAKYENIALDLKAALPSMIERGVTRLPSEAELCGKYGTSRQTVRSALELLEREGLIDKRHGSGSYIRVRPASREIALLVPSEYDYIYPSVIRTIRAETESLGFTLHVYITAFSSARERELLSGLLLTMPAGIICEGVKTAMPCLNADLFASLEAKKVPLVFLGKAFRELGNAVAFGPDPYSEGYSLARYLIGRGQKDICGILPYDDADGTEHYRGLVSAMRDEGIFPDDGSFLFLPQYELTDYCAGKAVPMIDRFALSRERKGRVIVCSSDELAYRIIKVIMRAGVKLPGETGVAAFGSTWYRTLGVPSITATGCDFTEAGRAAAKAVIGAALNRPAIGMTQKSILYVGESC